MRSDALIPGWLGRLFALPNEDPRKVVTVALTLCLICSVVVSAAAVGLRPLQQRNADLALKREILAVAGLADQGLDIETAFARIETRLLELDTGAFVGDSVPPGYSYREAAKDPQLSAALAGDDIAGIRRRPHRMPVYLVRDGGELQTLILPVYGYGLWSTLHGLLAIAADGRTAKALTFYDQRETAGLGDEITNPRWLAQWHGKTLVDAAGVPLIQVVKGSVNPEDPAAATKVDGISGATLTTNGVANLMRFWLGERGFGPLLERLRRGEI